MQGRKKNGTTFQPGRPGVEDRLGEPEDGLVQVLLLVPQLEAG